MDTLPNADDLDTVQDKYHKKCQSGPRPSLAPLIPMAQVLTNGLAFALARENAIPNRRSVRDASALFYAQFNPCFHLL